ncbi:hypothetical protein I4U23_022002 [Adineta vaga]|nr:hypothetical protein I4U23_022002 [Adineta vaga]
MILQRLEISVEIILANVSDLNGPCFIWWSVFLKSNDQISARVFKDSDEIFKQLIQDQVIRKQQDDSTLISLITSESESLQSRNATSMWFLLYIEILLEMRHSENAKQELIELCLKKYEDKPNELINIHEFQSEYTAEKAIWWYSKESCFFRLVNNALRCRDFDMLFNCRFFITDIAKIIKREYERFIRTNLTKDQFTVYRGQSVSDNELQIMHNNIGEFISMNSFLSTSRNRKMALSFVPNYKTESGKKAVLFEILIDPRLPTKAFSDIKQYSSFPTEDEVLLMLGALFRIDSITEESKKKMYIIKLSLANENDYHLKDIFNYMKKKIGNENTLDSLGKILQEMGEYQHALKYYEQMMHETQLTIANCHMGMGRAMYGIMSYGNALKYYQTSLTIRERELGKDHEQVGLCYSRVGVALCRDGEMHKIIKWNQYCDNDTQDSSEDSIPYPANAYPLIRTNATVRSIFNTQSYQSNINNIEVIWLDININNDEDHSDTQAKLCALIESFQIFSDLDECIDYIVSMKDHPIILITSGSIGKYLLPLIYNIDQIVYIYIFCKNVNMHNIWARNYIKVCGVFCDKDILVSKLMKDLESFETAINIFSPSNTQDTKQETSIKNCEAERQSMIWYQLIIEALLRMNDSSNEKNEMLEECRKHYIHDKTEYAKIIEFENNFNKNDAIRWYTRDSFLYRLFNKALRTQNVRFIYKFRFFLKALYNQLTHVYNTETVHSKPIQEVYRGQMLRIDELQKIKDSIGGIVSFHSFLSATKDKNVAVVFAGNGRGRPFFESVVFCIEIFWEFHPYIETTFRITNQAGIDAKPFADVTNYTYFRGEEEILFAMGSVFKIYSVKYIETVWYVKCKFYPSGNGNFLNHEIRSWNVMLGYNPRIDIIGDFLLELSDYESAIYFYVLSADNQFDDLSVSWRDYKLGRLYMRKGEYQTAFEYLQKAENLMLSNVSQTDFWLKNILETIGDTYMKRAQEKYNSQNDYKMAIVNYKKALNTVAEKRSDKQNHRSSNFQTSRIILGSNDEEVMRAEISYKLFKAYCKTDDHRNGEYFGEVFLTILRSNLAYKYKTSEEQCRSVFAIGVDSRTINTYKFRQLMFSGVFYILEGAIIPDCADIYRRCNEFIQLTNDKEKKMICCEFISNICSPLYPSLYNLLLFSHKYSLLINSEYEDEYSNFFVFQENIAKSELSNMPASFAEHVRACTVSLYLDEMLKRRLKFEELDELFLIQMMDFHIATSIKRQDFLSTIPSTRRKQNIDLSLDYDENFVLVKHYLYYQRSPKSTDDAYQMLTLFENQVKLLLMMNISKAALSSPYRNIARLYVYIKTIQKFIDDTINGALKSTSQKFEDKLEVLKDNKIIMRLWNHFKNFYQKNYQTIEEEKKRLRKFTHNLKFIIKENVRFRSGIKSFKLHMNHLGDMSLAEVRQKMTGLQSDTMTYGKSSSRQRQKRFLFDSLKKKMKKVKDKIKNKLHIGKNYKNDTDNYVMPVTKRSTTTMFSNSMLDYRPYMNPIENQGGCGSCYAFAATAAIEGTYALRTGARIELSQQQLVDCSSNRGCAGGFYDVTFQYIKQNGGLETKESYPYVGIQQSCSSQSARTGAFQEYGRTQNGDEESMKQALLTYGPLAAAISITSSFQFYGSSEQTDASDIIDIPSCPQSVNHAITIVGFGTEHGQDYWLVRNSWGDNWGLNGYFKIARNKGNMCGIATYSYYVQL